MISMYEQIAIGAMVVALILITGLAYIVKLVCGCIKGSSTRSPPPRTSKLSSIECRECAACKLREKYKFTALDISAPLLPAEDNADRISVYDNVQQRTAIVSEPIVIPISRPSTVPSLINDYDVPRPINSTFRVCDKVNPTMITTTTVPEPTHGILHSSMKNVYASQDESGPYEIMLPRTHIYNSAAGNN